MNLIALYISLISLILVTGTWIYYTGTILKMKVAVKPNGTILSLSVGFILGVIAPVINYYYNGIVSLGVLLPAIFALFLVSIFFIFYFQRKTPVGDLKVNIGDKIIPFTAIESDGTAFHSENLIGKRTLLKFFRGGW